MGVARCHQLPSVAIMTPPAPAAAILLVSQAFLAAASSSPQRIGGFQSGLSFYGDDDYSQFGDYDNYDPQQEEEEETFAFESSFEKNQQQQLMQEQEQPAASFSLADGFPEDDNVEGQEAEEGGKREDPSLREFTLTLSRLLFHLSQMQ